MAIPDTSGIYILRFASGHFYIGQAASLIKRWRTHRSSFRNAQMRRHHPKLFNVWAKHGEPVFEVLEEVAVDVLSDIEQKHITANWGDPLFCNTNPDSRTSRGVKRTHIPWQLGKAFTPEHRQRLSEAKQGKVSGINNSNHKLTEQQIREIREKYVPFKNGSIKLGREYGVSNRTILYIIKGERYSNVTI